MENLQNFAAQSWITWTLGILVILFFISIINRFARIPVLSIGTLFTMFTLRESVFIGILMSLSIASYTLIPSTLRLMIMILSILTFLCSLWISKSILRVAKDKNVKLNLKQYWLGEHRKYAADVEIEKYITYKDKDYGLSIWRPKGTTQLAPIIIYIHGGAWTMCSRFILGRRHCTHFSDAGFMAVNVDYPLSDNTHANWADQDYVCSQVVLWLQEHAAEYGGDFRHILLTGDSAGGNLAINIATRINDGTFAARAGKDFPKITAIAALYPGTATEDIYGHEDPLFRIRTNRNIQKHIGGIPKDCPEQAHYMSSIDTCNEQTPPMLLMYGDHDHLIPQFSINKLINKVKKVGTPLKVICMPYSDHCFDYLDSIGGVIYEVLLMRWFQKYIKE